MREHKNFWDRNASLYDCFMRKDRAVYEKTADLYGMCEIGGVIMSKKATEF